MDAEKVICDHTEKSLDLSGVKAKISTSEPRFHFFAFKHSYEGAEQSPVGTTPLFILVLLSLLLTRSSFIVGFY